jgi:hypothetical protein
MEDFGRRGTVVAIQVPIPWRMYSGPRPSALNGVQLIWINIYSTKYNYSCELVGAAEEDKWKADGWTDNAVGIQNMQRGRFATNRKEV